MHPRLRRARAYCGALALLSAATVSSCRKQHSAPAAPPPAEVGIVVLQPESVVLTTELPGRTAAYEASEVRPQVSGVIQKRLFEEGQKVTRGQTLYQIDARLYRAALAQARANLHSS